MKHMIWRLIFFCLIKPILLSALTYIPPHSSRILINLNNNWKFYKGDLIDATSLNFNDSHWQSIHIPHTWNAQDGQDGGNNYWRGSGWYRKKIHVDIKYKNRQIYLDFEGANQVTDVYINNQFLGTHKGGYARFRFDATQFIRFDTVNIIAVKVSNAFFANIPPLTADFTFFGGIYRNVNLLITDKLQLSPMVYGSTGVYITQTNVTRYSADLTIKSCIFNNYTNEKPVTVRSVVTDRENNIIKVFSTTEILNAQSGKDFQQSTVILHPHLWNGLKDPYLYKVFVEVKDRNKVVDLVEQPLGFRNFEVDADQGFFLNGQYLNLYGVNKHQDRPNKGWCIKETEQLEDFNFLTDLGATAVRLCHYQHADYAYKICDEKGFIVWAELSLVNHINQNPKFIQSAEEQLKELIHQNYNHPSIFFWGLANEVRTTNFATSLIKRLNNLAHQEDPTRLTVIATNNVDNASINWNTDLTAFNKYFGWYNNTLADFAPWIDKIHKNYSLAKIGLSEFGAGASINQHQEKGFRIYPGGKWHPEEYQALYHETYWKVMKNRPFIWAKFIWVMFDFASDDRNEGDTSGRNDKGIVTADRKTKKDAYYWYKVNWTTSPLVYITSRRWTQRTAAVTNIKIYSNCDSVDLKVNGIFLGKKKSEDRIFIWKSVELSGGKNTIQVIGYQNNSRCMDSCVWYYTPPPPKPTPSK